MTAERHGGDQPISAISPPNAVAPAVSLCPGFYTLDPRPAYGDLYANCDVCGVAGLAGERCQQTVIE